MVSASSNSLVLRQAVEHDFSCICEFYSQNAHPSLAVRSSNELGEAVQHGRCFVIQKESEGSLLAASLVLVHMGGQYREAAGSRITSPVGGLGLHHIMYRVRAIHECLVGELDSFFTAINSRNQKSISNALDEGFQDWTDTPSQILNGARARCGIDTRVLILPAQLIANHAHWLLSTGGSIELARHNRQTEKQEIFNLKIEVEGLFRHRDRPKKSLGHSEKQEGLS